MLAFPRNCEEVRCGGHPQDAFGVWQHSSQATPPPRAKAQTEVPPSRGATLPLALLGLPLGSLTKTHQRASLWLSPLSKNQSDPRLSDHAFTIPRETKLKTNKQERAQINTK